VTICVGQLLDTLDRCMLDVDYRIDCLEFGDRVGRPDVYTILRDATSEESAEAREWARSRNWPVVDHEGNGDNRPFFVVRRPNHRTLLMVVPA
jgi:hypothetical protein